MPEQLFYSLALIISIIGLAVIDRRFSLAYWRDKKATLLTIAFSVVIFSVWDVFGVTLGIFFHDGSPYTLALRILPDFPIEELLFLTLLSYNALLLYRGLDRRLVK